MASHIHRTHRSGWLRAGVLGAHDGVLSFSSLILGVAAAHTSRPGILATGLAGLIGGTLSMGAGEYVSVSLQADTEPATHRDDFPTYARVHVDSLEIQPCNARAAGTAARDRHP